MHVRLKGLRQDANGTVYELRFMGADDVVDVETQIPVGPRYLELDELAASPAAPAANKVRLFSKDSGAGKTQVCARFPTGAVVVLGVEP